LDFHKTMANYLAAKARLFRMCDIAILNSDDEATKKIAALSDAEIYYYSITDKAADFYATDIGYSAVDGTHLKLIHAGGEMQIHSALYGDIYTYNTLAAVGAALLLGIPTHAVLPALQDIMIPGRMERIDVDAPFSVYIDYAHTANSLKGALAAFRKTTEGRLIVLFGCGGDKDKEKRPMMGRVAAEVADFSVVTSDNPRREDPMAIINDILAGIPTDYRDRCTVIPDRREAIAYALGMAQKGDTVVLAGKGHEDYLIDASGTSGFSEREIVINILTGSRP